MGLLLGTPCPSPPTIPTTRKRIRVTSRKPSMVRKKPLHAKLVRLTPNERFAKLVPLAMVMTTGATTLPINEPMTVANVFLTIILMVRLSIPLCTTNAPNLPYTPPILTQHKRTLSLVKR